MSALQAKSPSFERDLEQLGSTGRRTGRQRGGPGAQSRADVSDGRGAQPFPITISWPSARPRPPLMYRLFDLRIALRARIAEFEKRGLMGPDVVQGLRDVFRILRYVSDMLGEIAIGNARVGEGDYALRAFTGRDRNTLVNYAFYNAKELPFRTGDVVLVRGRAHNSAAIARIGQATVSSVIPASSTSMARESTGWSKA